MKAFENVEKAIADAKYVALACEKDPKYIAEFNQDMEDELYEFNEMLQKDYLEKAGGKNGSKI